MKATVEKLEQSKVQLEVEVGEEQVEQALHKAYLKVVKQINVPGFRKGKVPRKILEARFGQEVLYDDALEFVIPDAYIKAIEETGIQPVEQPKIDVTQFESGKPAIFKATVTVKPEVTLGQYKELEYEVKPVEVSEEDVQRQLETMQKRHARLTALDGDAVAQLGDTVLIDFEGFKDDVPFEGGKGEDFTLELGSNRFIPGFEEGLVGVKIGEEASLNLTFPEEYHAEELAGQAVVFKVTIKEIKRKELADIDDEFAKDVSEFDTLDELKADIRKKLTEAGEQALEQYKRNTVIEKAVEKAQVDVPAVMVESQVEYMVRDYARRLEYQGLELGKFLELTQQTMGDLQEKFRPDAEKTVVKELVLEAIGKAEGLTVSDEDLDAEISKLSVQYNQAPEKMVETLERTGNIEAFKEGIMAEKTVDFLLSQAKEIPANS